MRLPEAGPLPAPAGGAALFFLRTISGSYSGVEGTVLVDFLVIAVVEGSLSIKSHLADDTIDGRTNRPGAINSEDR
jgi:hypothetical protein